MKKNLLVACALSLTGSVAVPLVAQTAIDGPNKVKIGAEATFSVAENSEVTAYKWLLPTGCRAVSGQNTPTLTLRSTFLSQDSRLRMVRVFSDQHTDTLSTDISFDRYITNVVDHSISEGQSCVINGKEQSVADIYYEPVNGDTEHVTAHRLTVVPTAFTDMTQPHLQTATANSIWISWKTSFDNTPEVIFGTDEDNMSSTTQGTTGKLSDTYYWNSVELTGLQPNTAYCYKVKSGDKESQTYRFKTMPEIGSNRHMRILLMGDHQIKTRSGYEWLMQAAKRKIQEKYGNLEDNINMIMNVGDQVDNGTLDQYEWIHMFKSKLMSPYLPIMTAIGNHETYNDPGMANYAAHYHYENLEYKGISSGTENYYAYQAGRLLFVVLDTEHTGKEQKAWVRKVVDAAKDDDTVDFIISVNHRPIQAEQYIGDISSWAREEIMPILSETPKHIFNYGGHHHLYHRGQLTDYPIYHIINGAASWDQLWGMSSEKDYDDVQKTIDYWGYQILDFDFEKKEMTTECYAIGNRDLVVDNILIDSFHRTLGKAAPEKPELASIPDSITLPYTFVGSEYETTTDEPLNSVQIEVSTTSDFSSIVLNKVTDTEDLYGSTGKPWHIPVDLNENTDITRYTVDQYKLKNGNYYVRLRYRDSNLEWSEWSDVRNFKVVGSIDGDPAISMSKKAYAIGEEIAVSYKYTPENQDAWIGIYRYGENPGSTVSVKWGYTQGQSGTLKFSFDEQGEYFAVLFKDGGYTEAAERVRFFVGDVPELSMEKTTFNEGEAIEVSYKNAPALSQDWIGIYKMGKTPGTSDASGNWAYSDSWKYIDDGAKEGKVVLDTPLPKGYYFVSYFTRGGYFEPSDERLYFSIGDKISTVATEKTVYDDDEDIKVTYSDGPGTPKDWVGVFAEGKDPNTDMLDGFYYTYGATDGFVTIPAADLKPGDYFCALYINDSYTEVSERIHFSIKSTTSSIEQTSLKPSCSFNAATSTITIDDAAHFTTARVISASGQTVKTVTLNSTTAATISVSSLPSGLYIVSLEGQGQSVAMKFIKK